MFRIQWYNQLIGLVRACSSDNEIERMNKLLLNISISECFERFNSKVGEEVDMKLSLHEWEHCNIYI